MVSASTALLWQQFGRTPRAQLDVARELVAVDRLVLALASGESADPAADHVRLEGALAHVASLDGAAELEPAFAKLRIAARAVDATATSRDHGLDAYLDARADVGSRGLAAASQAEAQRLAVLTAATGTAGVLLLGMGAVVGVGVRRRRRSPKPVTPGAIATMGTYDTTLLTQELTEAARRAVDSQSPLACVMVEVDHFAAYADTQGSAAGELLLGAIGDIVRDAVRARDGAYRWDETTFVLTLPEADSSSATRLAERLRESIVRALLKEGVTVSAGVADIPGSASDADDLLAATRAALADAQRHGRNQVRRASVDPDELKTARDNVGRH